MTKFKSIVDILLVGLILFQMFKIMRGTKGIFLLNGVLILYLAYIGSSSLGLKSLSTLLNWIMMMLIVALPIIFQNELKRFLESLGSKNPILKWFLNPPPIAPQSIDIVVEAAESLAKARIGALIVFEREDRLTVVGESGSPIDGVVNKVLVEQLFYPGSPLHDGAILIKGNRIQAAGCFLPLDNGLSLPQELGSRHRAGLSLSAQSDALVVVVSEETGQIALACHGRLERNLSGESLRFRLRELIEQSTEKAGPGVSQSGDSKMEVS
ncbi:diadenylate cyclase [Hydrogenispora ethanolica]|uniref:Diadenylate cyclase n=1 Tax=Hydrogenispora ethanolica TaxID=1082276 RepID=A0A4R1QPI1_HYDET|nr:diadenylate cyclase CdaA [Hydrogenispora ethanolica]TCL55719.1 diadenylate cyclase [Hydrogenispora ethanolica]